MAIGLRGCWSSISPIPDLRLADKKASEAAGGSSYKCIRNQPYFHSPLKIAYSRVPNNRVYAEIVALQQNSQQGWPVALRGRFPGRGSKKYSRPPLSTPLIFFSSIHTRLFGIRESRCPKSQGYATVSFVSSRRIVFCSFCRFVSNFL